MRVSAKELPKWSPKRYFIASYSTFIVTTTVFSITLLRAECKQVFKPVLSPTPYKELEVFAVFMTQFSAKYVSVPICYMKIYSYKLIFFVTKGYVCQSGMNDT